MKKILQLLNINYRSKREKFAAFSLLWIVIHTLLIRSTTIIKVGFIVKFIGVVFIFTSIFYLISYIKKDYRYCFSKVNIKVFYLYKSLLIFNIIYIVYGAIFDDRCQPLTFWGNIEYVPAFLLPLFAIIGLNQKSFIILLKILSYFSLLAIPLYFISYYSFLFCGWTLFIPLAFYRYLPKKLRVPLLITAIVYTGITWIEGARTPAIRTGLVFLIIGYSYLKRSINKKVMYGIVAYIIILPFFYFYIFLTTGFSIFAEESSKAAKDLGTNVTVDTRTFLYEEVIDDLKRKKSLWLGKGINGTYYSPYFTLSSDADNGLRINPEVGFLSYMLKGGIIYTSLNIILCLLAIWSSLFKSKSLFAHIVGLLLLSHFCLLFIENIPQYTLYNASIWILIGFALNKSIRALTETKVKDKN